MLLLRDDTAAVRTAGTWLRPHAEPGRAVAKMSFCGGLLLLPFRIADGFFRQLDFAMASEMRAARIKLSRARIRRIDLAHDPPTPDSNLRGKAVSTHPSKQIVDSGVRGPSLVPR